MAAMLTVMDVKIAITIGMARIAYILTLIGTRITTMLGLIIARGARYGSTGSSMISIVTAGHVPTTQAGGMINWWITAITTMAG